MKPTRVHFSLLALVAFVMVLASGFVLKFNTPDSKTLALGWGFVFTAGCIFFIRAIMVINKLNRKP